MKNTLIADIYAHVPKYLNHPVTLAGWIRTVRDSKKFGFMEINDGSFFKGLQVVFEDHLPNFETLTKIPVGSGVKVQGTLVQSQGKGQSIEIKAENIEIVAASESDYPLQKKRHSFEFLRTIAHLRPRTNTFSAVFRLRSVLSHAIHRFFQERDFVNVHTPILTTNDCEGAGEMFQVTTLDLENIPKKEGGPDFDQDFFGAKTGLTVSGQLNVEAYALAFGKVYTFGPTFRAENSNTSRHAAEFWMLEPEMAFAGLSENMDLAESMMKFVIQETMAKLPEEMEFFDRFIQPGIVERLQKIVDAGFERITYSKAIEILEKADEKFEFPVSWGIDLQSEHEQYICQKLSKPVFVTDYPKDIKAFYMRLNDDHKTVAAMDLLVPGVGEIIGGSAREERLEILDQRMKAFHIESEGLFWYRELRKYGGVPHAGFGLGFERLILYMTGMSNIRDVIPFPRTPRHAEF